MATTTKQRLTLFLNPLLVKQARAQAVVEEITLTSLVEKSLVSYLPTVTVIKKPKVIIVKKRG